MQKAQLSLKRSCSSKQQVPTAVKFPPPPSLTSKGQGVDGEMHDGVVEDQGAAARLVLEPLHGVPPGGEDVHGEGLVAAGDVLHGLVHGADIDDGEDRAEYLLLDKGEGYYLGAGGSVKNVGSTWMDCWMNRI